MTPIYTLLDLKGLAYHSYFASMSENPLWDTEGKPVNPGSYGFRSFLTLYMDNILQFAQTPMHIIGCVDGDYSAYRTTIFPEYKKARREKVQDEVFKKQLELCYTYIKQFLASLGCTLLTVKDVEADDLVAYLAGSLKGDKVIFTVDQDLISLADESTKVFMKGDMVEDMKGIPPKLVPLYKSIVGDSSDGYPGVKGVGAKGWESLVNDFGLDGMLELDELIREEDRVRIRATADLANNKVLHKCVGDLSTWFLQYNLSRLHPELCESARVSIKHYKRLPTKERLEGVLKGTDTLDFYDLYSKYIYKQTLVTKSNLKESLEKVKSLIPESPFVGFDYETYDTLKSQRYVEAAKGKPFVDMLNSHITGCSFALGANCNEVFYFSVQHKDTDNVDKSVITEVLTDVQNSDIKLAVQNVNFESTITKMQLGIDLPDSLDTRLFAHHIDENTENGLKVLSRNYLNYAQKSYKETLDAAGASDMSDITGEQVLSYGCDDAIVTAHLLALFTIITSVEGTYDFLDKYECNAIKPLVRAHIQGVKVDTEEMSQQTKLDQQIKDETLRTLHELLKANASQPNPEAVKRLYKDQEPFLRYKALKSGRNESQVLSAYKDKLVENSYYKEPYTELVYKKFIPTANKIKHITDKLGLPALTTISGVGISDWVSDNPEVKDHPFTDLLLQAHNSKELSSRTGKVYEALENYCNELLMQDAVEVAHGTELNMGSPTQNQHLLYLLLDLPIRSRTKVQKGSLRHEGKFEGTPGTDESTIELALANDCQEQWKADALKTLMKHKDAATRLGLFWNTYPNWLDDEGFMHPEFVNCGTVTRRPTGRSPNLLQVSKGRVRRIFVPRSEGRVIVSIDFGSEELRVLASACMDEKLLSAYMSDVDKDLHALTACGVLPRMLAKYPHLNTKDILTSATGAVDYEWFKAHQDDRGELGDLIRKSRGYGKVANFGVGYGAGPVTVSRQLMIPIEDAELIVESMQKTYPGIQQWKDQVNSKARKLGYVATTYGSRRHIGTGMLVGDRSSVGRWERQASNFLIQGQCADLLKVALVQLTDRKVLDRFNANLIAPVYDELLLEAPIEGLHKFIHEVSDCMEVSMPGIVVPMVADVSIGKNWCDQVELGHRPDEAKVAQAIESIFSKPIEEGDVEDIIHRCDLEDLEELGE